MTTRTPQQADTSRRNGSESRGPTSAEGKARASLNATRHGIRAERTLLPDEPLETYLAEVERWVESLQPETEAEREIVLDLVDLRVRLGRVDKAEKRLLLAALADDLQQLPETERLRTARDAITALSTMEQVVASLPQTGFESGAQLLPILRSVVALAKRSEALEAAPIAELGQLEDAVERLDPTGPWPAPAYVSLPERARAVVAHLQRLVGRDERSLREAKSDLLAQAVPKNDTNSKRLDAYRRQLERRMKAQTDLLEQFRRLRPDRTPGSFVKPIQVSLRSLPPRDGNLAHS